MVDVVYLIYQVFLPEFRLLFVGAVVFDVGHLERRMGILLSV
jgi:hypothetical protein